MRYPHEWRATAAFLVNNQKRLDELRERALDEQWEAERKKMLDSALIIPDKMFPSPYDAKDDCVDLDVKLTPPPGLKYTKHAKTMPVQWETMEEMDSDSAP